MKLNQEIYTVLKNEFGQDVEIDFHDEK